MRTIAITLALSGALAAAEADKKPEAKPLNKEQRLQIENVSLKVQLLRTQEQALRAEQTQVAREICMALVKEETCQIDTQTETWTASPRPPVAAKEETKK